MSKLKNQHNSKTRKISKLGTLFGGDGPIPFPFGEIEHVINVHGDHQLIFAKRYVRRKLVLLQNEVVHVIKSLKAIFEQKHPAQK